MVQSLRPGWTVQAQTPITSGTDAVSFVTVRTGTGDEEFVLKACTSVPAADFRPEPYLLSLLARETSVPVPHVVGAVDSHPELPAPFFLMRRCPGVLADDVDLTRELRARLAKDAGRFAGEYHAVCEFERFGYVRVDRDRSNARVGARVDGRTLAVADDAATTWRAYVADMYEGWIDDLDDEFADLEPDFRAFIEPRLDALDGSFEPVLGHIDYKPWNVLLRPDSGETTAVLDWGHATAMAPYYDLVLAEEHLSRWAPLGSERRERVRAALAEGYTETNAPDRDAGFEARRELYLAVARLQPLVWFSEWTADVPADERRRRAAKHREFVADLVG